MVSQWDLGACNVDNGKITVAGRLLTGTDENSLGFVFSCRLSRWKSVVVHQILVFFVVGVQDRLNGALCGSKISPLLPLLAVVHLTGC